MVRKKSSVAMYEQIAQVFRDKIRSKAVAPGDCIGSHTELADQFSVSIITVRKAVELLVDEGLLETRQGKGTFVKIRQVQDGYNRLTDFMTVAAKKQMQGKIIIRSMEFIPTPAFFPKPIADIFGDICLLVERMYEIDGNYVGYVKMYLRYEYGKELTRDELETYTGYYLFEHKLGIKLGKGIQTIYAGVADEELSKIMGISEGTALFIFDRESYAADGTLLAYSVSYYKHSIYSFKIELDLVSDLDGCQKIGN
ncbi:MAG: GntR family transcriptional regulator [Bacillota bacterium]